MTNFLASLIFLASPLLGAASSAPGSTKPPLQPIKECYWRLDRSLVKGDFTAWSEILSKSCVVAMEEEPERFDHDRFLTFMTNMGKMAKVRKASSKVNSLKPDPKRPGAWDADVISTVTDSFINPGSGGSGGRPVALSQTQRCTDVWLKEAAGWRIVHRLVRADKN